LKVAERTAELEKAIEERHADLQFLESLDRVNRAIQSTNDLERMTSQVLHLVLSMFDCDRAWLVYPCDPKASSWRAVMEHTRPEFPGAFALGVDLPMDDDVARVFRAGRESSDPVLFGPAARLPVPSQLTERFDVQSVMAMAIYPRVDEPYMLGVHQCSYGRTWTSREQRLFQEIGGRLADGLTTLLMFRNLRESEARLANAQRTAHVAYWERDLRTDRVVCSAEGYRIMGLPPQDQPMPAKEIQARIHPADLPVMARAVEDAITRGLPYEAEYRLVRPSGEVRIVHSQGDVERDESGRPVRLCGFFQDITERRGAEYLTKHVFETLPDGVCVIGRDFRYQRVNSLYERLFQMPAEKMVGMHVVERAGVKMFEQTLKPRLERCFGGEQASYAEWVDGVAGHRYLSMTYSPLRSTGFDEVDSALVITRDLTEHMVASEALQQAQAELARVTRVTMLGEITASIAHEVNQPLAAVVMNGNACRRWLSANPPNLDEALEAAQRVVSDGERAGQVIARIRALVRRGATERHPLAVNDVVREALGFVRAELEQKGVGIRADLSGGLPAILGDRVQLQQVMVNLALNAGDAMADVPAAQRELTVRSRCENGNDVVVEVIDRGRGISPGDSARLFEAFFSTKTGGLGMGLTISRSIVEMHGGRIWATSSEDGGGATLRLVLPTIGTSGDR
jgi:PAS domain S-box-containing protein